MPAPSPAPQVQWTVAGATVRATRLNAAEAGATSKLERRANGGIAAWSVRDTDAAPAIGTVLEDTGVAAGVYEFEVADYNGSNERTFTGSRMSRVVIGASQWDAVLAVVRAEIEGLGVDATDVYDGERPAANYSDATYVLRPLPERTLNRANGDLVLREYPVEVEYRATVQEQDGADRLRAVRDAQDALVVVFDGATPADLPSLSGLERVTVEVTAKSESQGSFERETVSKLRINFPIWETR